MGTSPLVAPPAITEGLGNWYANLIRIDRRKCLLFTNEKTLYSFLIPKVLKANLKNIEQEFLINLSYNLQYEEFGLEVINRVMQEYKEIGFAKTSNRQVLGSMNELTFQYEVLIEQKEGLENIRIMELNKHINRTIMGALKYKHPIEGLSNFV
ncbi:MAG: hypothetical protein WC853_13355 [Thermodesulfovibrionales bacterium]